MEAVPQCALPSCVEFAQVIKPRKAQRLRRVSHAGNGDGSQLRALRSRTAPVGREGRRGTRRRAAPRSGHGARRDGKETAAEQCEERPPRAAPFSPLPAPCGRAAPAGRDGAEGRQRGRAVRAQQRGSLGGRVPITGWE